MSFRFADLKKSVRRTKNGRVISPARLEGRAASVQVDFLLQRFESHLGEPRRKLDPTAVMEFLGDSKLARGLMATLSQWYRLRARTFPEVLARGGGMERTKLREHDLHTPVELRAWLYAAVNVGSQPCGPGFLEPEAAPLFWMRQARTLGIKREALERLMILDQPEEAVLVRTGPKPTPTDVMAAYNARAHTSLLRTSCEVSLRCSAPVWALDGAARDWADPLGVEWTRDGDRLTLRGQSDVFGCWSRHGRKVERVALELIGNPELAVREVRGRITAMEQPADYVWTGDALQTVGAGAGMVPLEAPLPSLQELAQELRRSREAGGPEWQIRQPSQVVAVEGGVCQPHLELRLGDQCLYLRQGAAEGESFSAFQGKTPVVLVTPQSDALRLRFPGEGGETVSAAEALRYLEGRLRGKAPETFALAA